MPRDIKNDWDKHWAKKEVKATINKNRMMKILKKYSHSKKILDAGCGSGFFSKFFVSKASEVVALDYSKQALNSTKVLDKRIKLIMGDILKTPFGDCVFDCIFSDGLLEHYKDPRKILLEFKRVLKPNGIIATFVPNKFSYWLLVKPLILKDIEENRFGLNKLIEINESIGFKIVESGGFSVLPFNLSPEFLGRHFGRIIYTIAKKGKE